MALVTTAAKTVFILGFSSDIGRELGERSLRDGWTVIGTYRQREGVASLEDKARLIHCHVSSSNSVRQAVAEYARLGQPWDIFISIKDTMPWN